MIYEKPGNTFAAVLTGAPTGLVGSLTFQIENIDGTTLLAADAAGIVEVEPGIYSVERQAPETAGTYIVVWNHGGTRVGEELIVTYSLPSAVPIEDEHLARLKLMSASDIPPTISDDELRTILALSRRLDVDGRYPDDEGWVTTYDFNYAAAAAWSVKAARAVGDYRFEEDNQVFHRDQVFRHCRDMIRRYNRGAVAVGGVSTY